MILLTAVTASASQKIAHKDLMDLANDSINANSREVKPEPKMMTTEPDNKIEVRIWNDPQFRKQFAMSYMAETEIEPGVTEDEREVMQEVLEHISAEEMDKAVKLLQKNTNDAASAVFEFTLGNIYFQQEELDRAIIVYKMAVDKYPKFLRAWKNLALIYVRQGYFDRAVPALTKTLELGDNSAVTYGLLGFSYSSVGNFLAAESAYRMAILLDPDTLDWKMGLARSFFKQQRYSESSAICDILIKQFPDRADLWLLQANAFIGLNKPLEAAQIYELVDQMGQSTFESLNMLGDIYVNEELFEMAAESYMRAMDVKPDHKPQRPLRNAKVLIARGALEETSELISKIESMHANSLSKEDRKDLLKLRARLVVAAGSGEEEVAVLEQIVELDPHDGEAILLLGQNSERKGNVEKAQFWYERAAAIEEFEADAKVRLAQLMVKSGKYAQALPLLRRAQMIKPRETVQKYLEQVERIAK